MPDRTTLRALTIPVVIDPDCEHEGVCEFRVDYSGGRAWPARIVMRAPEPRVLLHETLHALVGSLDRDTLPVEHPRHEAMVRHITRGLWDAGWRPTTTQEDQMSQSIAAHTMAQMLIEHGITAEDFTNVLKWAETGISTSPWTAYPEEGSERSRLHKKLRSMLTKMGAS